MAKSKVTKKDTQRQEVEKPTNERVTDVQNDIYAFVNALNFISEAAD